MADPREHQGGLVRAASEEQTIVSCLNKNRKVVKKQYKREREREREKNPEWLHLHLNRAQNTLRPSPPCLRNIHLFVHKGQSIFTLALAMVVKNSSFSVGQYFTFSRLGLCLKEATLGTQCLRGRLLQGMKNSNQYLY